MEQFNIPHQRIREKSVYLLHLDAARIILISAAVIGIVVVSFLLGMNFVKGGESARTFMTNNDIFDTQKELDLLKNNIPESPDEDELSKPMDEKLVASDKFEKEMNRDPMDKDKKDEKSASQKNELSDMLTKDTISETALQGKNAQKKTTGRDSADARKLSRSIDEDAANKPVKKIPVKNIDKKKKRGASKVIEVSGGNHERKKNHDSGYYAVQIGSFDKNSKALSEVRNLKDMNYDAYVDETQVKGKQYFRVRLGPLASKQKAIDLLNTMQRSEKYQDSYMVRE
ncbi:MAG: hypothetical protein A2176_04405 [Spirochaetes bacterium RBG_13_51_14]|nr:MAG: hypothetical protein A2176_04405 [Spirochaetes bacterium RBG_13_51_14]